MNIFFKLPDWVIFKSKCLNAAFSLVEMLMALLVASLLLAALAPVMTKKMDENVFVSGTGSAVMLQGGCIFMEGNYENVCKLPQNTLAIGAIIASGGGGGGGAARAAFGSTKYSDIINGTTAGSVSSNTITLNKNALDVKVQLVGGGGGGGLGSSNNGGYPKDQNDCGNWGVYVGAEYEGTGDTTPPNAAGTHPAVSAGYHSVCVSKYNAARNGTTTGPTPAISAYKICTAGTADCNVSACTTEHFCCWDGKTSSFCEASKNGMTYDGCHRPVCQWNAAYNTCYNWKPNGLQGRLPFQKEGSGWTIGADIWSTTSVSPLNWNGTTGLQLCNPAGGQNGWGADQNTNSSPHTSIHCSPGVGICTGGSLNTGGANSCYPSMLWFSDTPNNFGTSTYTSNAASVRCVIDRISSFSSVVGGGGGAGLYAEMKISDDAIRKALSEGTVKITYTAGGGGKGAYITSESNYNKLSDTSKITSAQSGVRSSVVLTVNDVAKWEFSVPGGIPGGNASINSIGAGGRLIDTSSNAVSDACYYKNTYSMNNEYKAGGYFKCSEINDNGIIPSLNQGSKGVNGGAGGSGHFAGVDKSGGGINSTPGYGGGGGGGASTTEGPTRDYVSYNTAGNGGGGMARITYKLSRPGAGGGGGGAGAVVHIPHITTAIRPDTTFNIQVGAGGAGGAAGGENDGSNGTQGGTSSIEWNDGNTTRYIRLTGGEGGKKGIIGKPDEGINGIDSVPGDAGLLAPVLSMSSGIAGKNDYIMYPSDLSKAAGKKVIPNRDYTVNYYAAPGGNGGINSKISPVDKKPCGGWSNMKIDYYGAKDINNDDEKYDCKLRNADDVNNPYAGTYIPYSISVSSEDSFRPDGGFKGSYAYIMSKANEERYAGSTIGGSTGGGGGGWKWFNNEDEHSYAGANGMPGFVIIYWNLDKEEG